MTLKMCETIVNLIFPIRKELDFDFPNYGGLPPKICCKLSPEAVDAMQDILQVKFNRKRTFLTAYKHRLWELGENVV